ncbi:unnamed protein product [Ceratitis capitata]|uniref:(Mediterranean fruit fly) hypothetical protein n=1 Tax=Ceratitis capitata TaxID=7213 RepID=A0A811VFD3_CERCA|nr:unnamed protein product [Ceratitis capitata]
MNGPIAAMNNTLASFELSSSSRSIFCYVSTLVCASASISFPTPHPSACLSPSSLTASSVAWVDASKRIKRENLRLSSPIVAIHSFLLFNLWSTRGGARRYSGGHGTLEWSLARGQHHQSH